MLVRTRAWDVALRNVVFNDKKPCANVSSDPTAYSVQSAHLAFAILFREFELRVLPTYQLRHVQYLLLFTCSRNHDLATAFVSAMLDRALDPVVSLVLRQTTAAYVASFLARAKFIEARFALPLLAALATRPSSQ